MNDNVIGINSKFFDPESVQNLTGIQCLSQTFATDEEVPAVKAKEVEEEIEIIF